jgi:hypothetical protein
MSKRYIKMILQFVNEATFCYTAIKYSKISYSIFNEKARSHILLMSDVYLEVIVLQTVALRCSLSHSLTKYCKHRCLISELGTSATSSGNSLFAT